MASPDILTIDIELPAIIVDMETYERLDPVDVNFEVEVPPQLSQYEIELLLKISRAAAVCGGALAIWQIIMLFSLGKALKSMWILINAL